VTKDPSGQGQVAAAISELELLSLRQKTIEYLQNNSGATLAGRIGCSEGHVSKWKNGQKTFTQALINKLITVLSTPVPVPVTAPVPIMYISATRSKKGVAGFQVGLQSAVSAAAGDTGGRRKYSKKNFWEDLEAAQKYRDSTTVLGVQD
jgi:hypothetical protein